MNRNYYEIVECNNERKDANYCLKIKWNVKEISGYCNAEGFIVQRVELIDETGIISNYNGPYFEAWKVKDGKTEYSDFDDAFQNGLDNLFDIFTDIVTENSLGKKGKIEYRTKVYWVDKSSVLYSSVKQWTPTVSMANKLPSVEETECGLFIEVDSTLERNFCHYVDF